MPRYIAREISQILNEYKGLKESLQEIRIRVSKPIILKKRDEDIVLKSTILYNDILNILEKICENSIYAYRNQICEGFITIQGGHRVGISGTCVIENGKIINVKYISCMNIRIAREVIGCSNKIINNIIDFEKQKINNTVIVSPPGKGKTTILRDLVRQISNGFINKNFKGKTVGLVDERGEISACYRGVPQNDIGIRTDVIENATKSKAIEILLRSMSPEIIACDEIGTKEDAKAIEKMLVSGVNGIFTMHGNSLEDVKANIEIGKLIDTNAIEKVIVL